MRSFEEQVKLFRESAQSISQLSQITLNTFSDKYSLNGNGGKEKFSGFLPGKIYTGLYMTDSKLSEKNTWINKYPLFFFIGEEKIGNEVILKAIDLNITPPDFRSQILRRIFDEFQNQISENEKNLASGQTEIILRSNDLNSLLVNTGYKFSVTGFKKKFFSNVKVIDYEDWVKIPYFSATSIEGIPINSIYSDYKSKLKL